MQILLGILSFIILLPILAIDRFVSLFRDEEKERQSKETLETLKLQQEVTALRASSPLAETLSDELHITIVKDALNRANIPDYPHIRIIEHMLDVTEAYIKSEGLGTIPTIPNNRPLGMEEGVRVRNYLRKQKRFYGDGQHLFTLWHETIAHMFSAYLSALPSTVCIDGEDTEFPTPLAADLINLIPQPASVIESIILSCVGEELEHAGLFEDTRAQLNDLYVEARKVMPSKASKGSPRDLVTSYLRDTPLAHLFAPTIPFTISVEARFEHCMIVAGTGHGKTQTLQSLMYEDLRHVQRGERSIVVIDSQGDLIDTIVHLAEFNPSAKNSLSDRLMLIDPNDIEFPVCLNMFATHTGRSNQYTLVAQEKLLNGVIELLEYVFGALLGAELTQKQGVIFRYIARLMLVIPNANLQTLVELMEDGRPFKPYMDTLEGSTKKFFETQFFEPGFNATKKQVLRRLWGVMSNPTFERMFSQSENKVDLFEAMNSGKIILINTAKDLLKQEGSEIFGRFFISLIAQAALERATIQPDERTPTFVYIDEAHEYFDGDDRTFEMLLGQARKYKIGFTTASQSLSQTSPRLRASMMANTSIKLAGGVSDTDARALAAEMRTDSNFIRGMYKRATHTEFACFVKHLTPSGITVSVPLGRMESQPSIEPLDYETVIERNRERYARPASYGVRVEPIPPRPEGIEVAGLPNTEIPEPEPTHRTPRRSLPVQQGRGGVKHKDMQETIRAIGHECGFLAEIEDEVFDTENRARQIDVALRKDGILIACEISITTKPEHEVENVARCFDAGVHHVMVIAPDPKHRLNIETLARAELPADLLRRVSVVLSVDDVKAQLADIDITPTSEETVIRGYKVVTTFGEPDPEEANRRRDTFIRAVLSKR